MNQIWRKIFCVFLFILAVNGKILLSQTLPVEESVYNTKIRVACIGNSVTFGYGFTNRDKDSYPAQLQQMLGEKYDVKNFGFNGANLLKKSRKPYWSLPQYSDALAFKPHIVIIHLGLNDTGPDYPDEFVSDYEALIKIFKEIETIPQPKVWICRMTPIFPWHPRYLKETGDYFRNTQNTIRKMQDSIEQVSVNMNVTLIDLNAPLCHRTDLFKDGIHPSVEGATIIASTVKSAITGNYGGLTMPGIITDHMVIQRQRPVIIWGTADTGQPVEVTLSANTKKTTAGGDGKWKVVLPAMEAGGPYTLIVQGEKSITINDILIGDVWVCSGQSNMAFKLKNSQNAEEVIPQSDEPQLRLFNFNPVVSIDASAFSPQNLQKINRGEYFAEGPWVICNPETAADFSAVAYYFGAKLVKELNIPVGLIHNAVGGSNTESWIWRKDLEFDTTTAVMLTDWLHNEQVQIWCREQATKNLKDAVNPLQRHPYEPGYLYQAGILPIISYPVSGVIWYQGESNADKTAQHEILFKMLVTGWREAWQNPDMPFLYVQLSSLNRESWPLFRDSQLRLLNQIPHTGMAVTSDLGHPTDVHPKNKKDVGNRLARWALALEYKKDIVPSGPLFKNTKVAGSKILISFDYATDRLKTSDGKVLRGFEIAGIDGRFTEAEATILKNKIIVKNKRIKDPVDVRYGWDPFTDANLINSEGLPASTFTTKKD